MPSHLDGTTSPQIKCLVNGIEFPVYGSPQVSTDDGETSGTARLDIIDIAKAVHEWDEIVVKMGYSGSYLDQFTGKINGISRGIETAEGGAVASLTCVGKTADILQIETTSPHFIASYPGFGNWHVGGWKRSEMLEDLCRIYNITPRVIQATTVIVEQKPFAQMKLGDIIAEICVPEFGKFLFDGSGVFQFFVVNPVGAPTNTIKEGETLLRIDADEEHDKVINQVLVIGQAVSPVNAVKPQGQVGSYSKQLTPGQVFAGEQIAITRSFNDAFLTHTSVVVQPSAYNISETWETRTYNNPVPFTDYFYFPRPGGGGTPQNEALSTQPVGDVIFKYLNVYSNSIFNDRLILWLQYTDATPDLLIVDVTGSGVMFNAINYTPAQNNNIRRLKITWGGAGGSLAVSFGDSPNARRVNYRQLPETGKTVTVTKRQDLINTNTDGQGTTIKYFMDIASTFLYDTVTVNVTPLGRAIAQAAFPIIFYATRDVASIGDFGERTVEIHAASIATVGEAQTFAEAILAAGKQLVETFSFVCAGNPYIKASSILRVQTTNTNPQLYFGASKDLYVLSVEQSFVIAAEGNTWETKIKAIPVDRSILAIVRNFGRNPIKDRASAQAEFLAGFITGQIFAVTTVVPFSPGEADKQKYSVKILSAKVDPVTGQPFVIKDVGNTSNEQFISGDTVLVIFQEADRTRPQIIGRSPQIITDGVSQLLTITAITPNGVNNTIVATANPHQFFTGNTVNIFGTNSAPNINGTRIVTVLTPTTFSIPFTTTGAGTTGTVVLG